ncbi:hypothetical protein QFC22_003510 [Naganishia vaughanmartiniae]|uniref:Uncharacterized protein n=1 Tax=Naganishia vaughanmartiniae TaxID=1424756 RepID=A0ACC2X7I7_9TREE|nr:hypothetical protein QFC22_003510 [Naganishia vaughanmartiniae]
MPEAVQSQKKLGGRTAIVGTGSRGQLFLRGVVDRAHIPGNAVVALCDSNEGRIKLYNRLLQELGQPQAAEYGEQDFEKMLDDEHVEVLVVTTVDATHDRYIIPALKRGIKVLTEKPMTTDIEKCKAILRTVKETNNHLTVTFNYRFNPVHEKVNPSVTYKSDMDVLIVQNLIEEGKIGKVLSVHFEWLLNTVHGADRWHRSKDNSGGLMVHKSGHHFDLVNWWVNSSPKQVVGMGKTAFYGKKNGEAHGWAKDYKRAYGSEEAKKDPFALDMDQDETLKELYVDNEQYDGYIRDSNVFGDDIAIEDDMSVLVRYQNGVIMTYHLTAYSPWEGYRVMFNGSHGRLELEVVESTHNSLEEPALVGPGSIHGTRPMANAGHARLSLHPLWQKPVDIPVYYDHAGHGGGDKRLLSSIFGPLKGDEPEREGASSMACTEVDGANALAIGLAANESFVTGKMIDVEEMLRI